jgi:hypothetical protein
MRKKYCNYFKNWKYIKICGKPSVIPVSSVPVFKFENSTPVIPIFYIIFHINLIKKSSRQGSLAGITGKSSQKGSSAGITDKIPRQGPPAGITDKSPRQRPPAGITVKNYKN